MHSVAPRLEPDMPSDHNNQYQGWSDYERLEHSLWSSLICICDYCKRCDEYAAALDAADNATEWAKIVAPLAQADGWSAPGMYFLLCPDCRTKGVDWQKHDTPPPGGLNAADPEHFQKWLDS